MRTDIQSTESISPKVNRYVPPPGHPLRPNLQSIWRGQAKGTIRREIILPKGNLDIVFCLSEPHRLTPNLFVPKPIRLYPCFVYGAQTRAFQVHPGRCYLLVGISLKIEACAAFLPIPTNEFNGLPVEGSLIFKDVDIIHEKLSETSDFQKQCKLIINWLHSLLRPPAKHKLIRHVCAGLQEMPTESKVREIARSVEISERHLRRLFLQQVGVSPARYLRLSRFIKTIHLIQSSSSLTEIAYEAHYTDQAHFCHDFKEMAGMTPKEYRKMVGNVPGHIFSA